MDLLRDRSRFKNRFHTPPKPPPFLSYQVGLSVGHRLNLTAKCPSPFANSISDIIPDPTLGSGSPALRISDLFSTQDFDQLNQEAAGQLQLPKNTRQQVDLVLQDLKPSQRTH